MDEGGDIVASKPDNVKGGLNCAGGLGSLTSVTHRFMRCMQYLMCCEKYRKLVNSK